ncbi:hypothetical protein BCR36DRAFT_284423 [Piromyces finnis]|uniref:Uncharacterized protein n=1 Tax=Piromyces finnis TaxID=1754191 RepID=A0A1Y1VEV3_9FUNG|nr:hypothetical protein BCR36DRAFT_284423 [Piromyces finnis]|eukprot:ORX53732.1 hypothetical protein BCR36DRAFT_284423 [Piromyces finnis]
MDIYLYCVFDYVYNCISSIPLIIIILNTFKLYTLPNYKYEFVVSSEKKLFTFNDVIFLYFFMYKKNLISIIDNAKLNKYINNMLQIIRQF